jgi:hypothetical protein
MQIRNLFGLRIIHMYMILGIWKLIQIRKLNSYVRICINSIIWIIFQRIMDIIRIYN